jgi:uncharacterized protein (DUF58 family)
LSSDAKSDLRARPPLPNPGVNLGRDVVRRIERFVLQAAALRERREGQGRADLDGGGSAFVGHRPYRAGEEVRHLDWGLLARLDQPFVRVLQREGQERWAILLDVSASMGVGAPGKLQAAAELAAALTLSGIRAGARVELIAQGKRIVVRRSVELVRLVPFLESLQASGTQGLGAAMTRGDVPSDAGRVVLFGDLLDARPSHLVSIARPGRDIWAVQLLAPVELAPKPGHTIRWLDPEGDGIHEVLVNEAAVTRYERKLEETLDAWQRAAVRHRFRWSMHSSASPFEETARMLVLGDG